MSSLSFNIASGKTGIKRGGAYSRSRVDMQASGLSRDLMASVVEGALPKVIGLLGDMTTKKLTKKIRGSGKYAGSYRLH